MKLRRSVARTIAGTASNKICRTCSLIYVDIAGGMAEPSDWTDLAFTQRKRRLESVALVFLLLYMQRLLRINPNSIDKESGND